MMAETMCVITDVQMPGLNGLELQEALQSQGRHIPVIVITAYANEKQRTRALNGGAVGFLSKPFKPADLLARVTQVLESSEFPKLKAEAADNGT